MRYRNIFWGVILILIGVLFTMENLNLIYFNFMELWRLWPVVLILWGVSILPAGKWVRMGLVMVALAGSVYYMLDRTVSERQTEWDGAEWPETEETLVNQEFDISNVDSIRFATLKMSAAAGEFLLRDTTGSLLHFSQNKTDMRYTYSKVVTDERVIITIGSPNSNMLLNNKPHSNVRVRLNKKPVWDINLDVGAAAVQFDLSPFKVKNLGLKSGAASLKIKLGDAYPETRVNIDAGVSELVLKVPEESGCDLKISAVLSVKEIEGFEKIDHRHYRTPNFDTAENKIFMEVNAAMSNYSIIRY